MSDNKSDESPEPSPDRPIALLNAVCDKDTFLNFVDALSRDADEAEAKQSAFSPNGWENGTIGSFLDAVVRCADGKPDRYPEEPSWKTFAEMLYGGKIYE